MSKRFVEYDLMRILACFLVITIHSSSIFEQNSLYSTASSELIGIHLWAVLARWAVPAFVMLSGMMVISTADSISLKKLIVYRVFRMIIVYFSWSCVYSFYNVYVLGRVYASTKLITFLDGCFSGELHMWYLLMLAGMYIISPILAALIKCLNKEWTIYWLAGMFVFSSLIPLLIKLDIIYFSVILNSYYTFMDLQFLGGWTLYFVLGYYLQKQELTRRETNIIIYCSIIGFIFTALGTVIYPMFYGETMGILPYEYPNIMFYSMGILLLFKERAGNLQWIKKYSKQIVSISKLTFGIYLIHVLLLEVFYSFGFNIQICHPVLSIPLVSLGVFVCSGAIIWLFRKIPIVGTYLA